MKIAPPAGLVKIHGQGKREGGGGIEISGLAPVEAGMGEENRESADGQCQKAQKVDPVRSSD